jgi:hypothetical protein
MPNPSSPSWSDFELPDHGKKSVNLRILLLGHERDHQRAHQILNLDYSAYYDPDRGIAMIIWHIAPHSFVVDL